MGKTKYKIIDDFQEEKTRVLILDSDYECFMPGKAVACIDGVSYDYRRCSSRKCVLIKSNETFKGKTVEFKRVDD